MRCTESLPGISMEIFIKQVMFFDEKSGAGSMKDAAQLDLIYSKMKKN